MIQIVIAVLPAFLLMAEQQAAAENEPKVITLSCNGTLTRAYGANKPTKRGTTVTLDPTKPDDPNIAKLRYNLLCKGAA